MDDLFFPSQASWQAPLSFCAETTPAESTHQAASMRDAPRGAFETELVAHSLAGACRVVWHVSAEPDTGPPKESAVDQRIGPSFVLAWHYDADATVLDDPACANSWVGELVDADYRFETRAHAITQDLNAYASVLSFESYFGYGYAYVAAMDQPEVHNGDLGFRVDSELGLVAGVPPSDGNGCLIDLPD